MQIVILRCEHCHHDNVLTVTKAGLEPPRYPIPDDEEKHAQGKQMLRDNAEAHEKHPEKFPPNVKRND